MTLYDKIRAPSRGSRITIEGGRLDVPDQPTVPFIEGDGIGRDIWQASRRVFDAAVEKAYGGRRRVHWMEVYAGEKATRVYGDGVWLPEETFDALREHVVSIKGPLTTPVGGGFRSLNVTLRQVLGLYACVRPVRYIEGVPTPNKRAHELDVVLFRENTEDLYGGVEFESGSEAARRLIALLEREHGAAQLRPDSGIGIKAISPQASKQLVRKAIRWAIDKELPSVTLMHKGNIMKFTEGAFKKWGFEVATEEFRDHVITESELWDETLADDGVTRVERTGAFAHLRGGKPAGSPNGRIIVKDRIADGMFQQIQTRPAEYSVIAAPYLNGDYLSDAAAAMVGGLGMAGGANLGDQIGVFEAIHGTAPKYAGKDMVNPTSLMLSGAMMFEYIGWDEAAVQLRRAIERTIARKTVTYDLHRLMEGATRVGTSGYASAIVENMD